MYELEVQIGFSGENSAISTSRRSAYECIGILRRIHS
jgi:hypothetical protein